MNVNQRVLVIGATQGTGYLIVNLLLRDGYQVRALARNEAKAKERTSHSWRCPRLAPTTSKVVRRVLGCLNAWTKTSATSARLILAPTDSGDYFKITVVDEETGRGVPLVELKTTNDVRYYTDSNGIIAFFEPGLDGQGSLLLRQKPRLRIHREA
jgi:NAD(P)-dependent dehydrogenase (short-subunit alcohol dehydrogenase family)